VIIGPKGFRRITELVWRTSRADHTLVRLEDREGQTVRFANNEVIQDVHTHRYQLTVTASLGARSGTASTTDLTPQGIQRVVERASEAARFAPEDPEYLPPLPPQEYERFPTSSPATAAAASWRLNEDVKTAIALCRDAGMSGAGLVAAYVTGAGVAADTGLFAYEERTRAEFSLTATGPDSSGWVRNDHRALDQLGVEERTRVAIEKARRSAAPKELAPGRYPVILEPAAVAGLLGPLLWACEARAYDRGTSALAGRLGERIVDPALTLRNDPAHPALLGDGFADDGLPNHPATWIENGTLKLLSRDRWTAKQKGVEPLEEPDAPHLEGAVPARDLLAGVERAILVTNFWYIRFVNPTDLTLTGMTRDGTFLVEDGAITTGLINFRFHESPLRAFERVEACGPAQEAVTMERTKMLLPTLRLPAFNFSSVTRF